MPGVLGEEERDRLSHIRARSIAARFSGYQWTSIDQAMMDRNYLLTLVDRLETLAARSPAPIAENRNVDATDCNSAPTSATRAAPILEEREATPTMLRPENDDARMLQEIANAVAAFQNYPLVERGYEAFLRDLAERLTARSSPPDQHPEVDAQRSRRVDMALHIVREFDGNSRCSLNCLYAEALADEVLTLRAARPLEDPEEKTNP